MSKDMLVQVVSPAVPAPKPAVVRQELPGSGTAVPAEPVASGPTLSQAVRNLNEYVQSINREIRFSVDEDSGMTVVKVVDPNSGDVIRQIPADEVLAVAHHLEQAQGLILRAKA